MGELGDLFEAIHDGGRELATVRAAISHRFNGRAMRQAMLDSARREGMPPAQLRRLGEISQSASSEHAVRLWLQPPDRFREELDRGLVTVRDGGHWWRFGPGVGTVTNTDSERDASESRSASGMSAPDPQYGYLFRPARFLGLLEFVPRGHGIVAGRSAWLVDATPSPSSSPLA